ncbi:hypothetical protein J3E68DRAFT_394220 [Trichoderma sp. SZMC 28012]
MQIHAHRIEIGIFNLQTKYLVLVLVPRTSHKQYFLQCRSDVHTGKALCICLSVSVPFLFRPPHIIFIASRPLILFRVLCSLLRDPCKVSSLT